MRTAYAVDLARRGPFGRGTDQETSHAEWEVVLDRIELDVMRAEHRLAQGVALTIFDRWDAPANHDPLPASLRERAEQLVARQHACLEEMSQLLGTTYRHLAAAEALGRSSCERDHALFVDIAI